MRTDVGPGRGEEVFDIVQDQSLEALDDDHGSECYGTVVVEAGCGGPFWGGDNGCRLQAGRDCSLGYRQVENVSEDLGQLKSTGLQDYRLEGAAAVWREAVGESKHEKLFSSSASPASRSPGAMAQPL